MHISGMGIKEEITEISIRYRAMKIREGMVRLTTILFRDLASPYFNNPDLRMLYPKNTMIIMAIIVSIKFEMHFSQL